MSVQIPLSRSMVALVDEVDADLGEGGLRWSISGYPPNLYAHGRHAVALHHIILERKLGRPILPGLVTDHVNGDGLDNRRANLREYTVAQNNGNRIDRWKPIDFSSTHVYTYVQGGHKAMRPVKKGARRVTSIVLSDGLRQRLKHAALRERTDVSTLLRRAAEEYLGRRKKGGR